ASAQHRPADVRRLASCPIETATSRQATRAKTTDRGRAPLAKLSPTMIETAPAAAGAMWVIDWNRTSRRPIASRARLGDGPFCAMARLLRRPPTTKTGIPHGEPRTSALQVARRRRTGRTRSGGGRDGGRGDILGRLRAGEEGGRQRSAGGEGGRHHRGGQRDRAGERTAVRGRGGAGVRGRPVGRGRGGGCGRGRRAVTAPRRA